ncbi:MAG TPA: SRPBCC family protein [Vicinamibacterales bacterium]|nr:SRPBCC family protein [Vicinamibacterales bacterium]
MAPVHRSQKRIAGSARTILFAATVLFTASVLAQTGFGQGKSLADAAGACAAQSNLDTTKPAAALTPAEINVEEKGDEFLIRAQSEVEADSAAIWSTLSDYDHLARFIPGMSSSRTVSRTGAEAIVEQKGSAGFGPFRQRFTVLLAVSEKMNQSISASAIGGDFKCFKSRYEIVPLGSRRARIVYRATLVPETPIPPIIGLAVRSMIGAQFDAVLEEIRRRAVR